MPSKKKTTPVVEPVKPAEAAPAPAKRKAAAPRGAAVAKHKPAARKPAVRKAAAQPAARPTAPFDESSHHEEISREAYLLWVNRGHEHGQAHEDWVRAVEIVRGRYSKS